MSDLKEQLLARRIVKVDDVPLEGFGTVRVRGLNRGEIYAIQKVHEPGTLPYEAAVLARALVDPEMSSDEVAEWQFNSPAGEMQPVVDKAMELSGLAEGADKSGLPGVRDDAESGIRVLPGDEAEHDSRPATGADE